MNSPIQKSFSHLAVSDGEGCGLQAAGCREMGDRRSQMGGSRYPISHIRSSSRLGLLTAVVVVLGWGGAVQAQTTIVGWDFNGLSAYGASPLNPSSVNGNVTVVGLTRSGLATTGTAASSAWGGVGNGSVSFTLKANTGFILSLTQVSGYNIRRSSFGATTGQWAYSLDGGANFVNIGTAITWGTVTSSSGNPQSTISLGGISALQNLPATTTVTFRLTLTGATTGTWYLNNFQTGNDFSVSGTVVPESGGNPLLSLALTPNPVAENAGSIASTGTVSVSSAPSSDLTVNLTSANTAAATVPATVTILAGQTSATFPIGVLPNPATYDDQSSLITASADNHTSGTATMVVANADKRPMTVVINRYINATPDKAELLVVGNGTPGGTVDMRGMIFKDFSSNMAGDGGTQYTFTSDALWAAVPVGTLIILAPIPSAADTDVTDFKLEIGLENTTYFTKTGNSTFDISTTEMLMIKAAGSGTGGINGGIHVLAAGAAGANYTAFVGHKLIASATTAAGQGVYANNANGVLADFDGTGATGGVASTDPAMIFGSASSAGNATFIAGLRGADPTDGSGAVILANSTAGSPYALSPIFARQASGQSVSLTLTGTLTDKAISEVTVLVPALLGTLVAENVSLAGTGAGAATASVSGQTITVSGAAVTTTASLTINISGLSTPALADLSSNLGNLPFTVSTAKAGGSLTALGASPSALVLIPIQTIRAVETNGTPTHNGKIVAVEGVCTDRLTSTGTAPAFLQDGQHGVSVFSSVITKVFEPGKRYALAGTVGAFNGLTQVQLLSPNAIAEVGVEALPTPRVLTLPLSFADAELYEGSLVQVTNANKASTETDLWGVNQTITVYSGSATNVTIDVRIQLNSTATTEPGYPATITGILGQFDSSSPRDSGYQIMPRTGSDLLYTGTPALTLTSNKNTLTEGLTGEANEATVEVRRSGPTTAAVTVEISSSPNGSLLADLDANLPYESLPGSITIPVGQASVLIYVVASNDSVFTGNRSATLTASAEGFTSGSSVFSVTEDDPQVGDTTPPVITLNGDNPLTVLWGLTWIDDYSAFDAGDNTNVTVNRVNPVDTKVPGSYTVTYTATDSKSNTATATRTVNVRFAGGGTNRGPDGLPDAVRFALGADGTNAMNPVLMPTSQMSNNALVLTYHGRPGSTPVELVPVVSTDLANSNGWGTAGITVTNLGPTNVNGVTLDRRQASVPTTDGTKKFLRLRATTSQ